MEQNNESAAPLADVRSALDRIERLTLLGAKNIFDLDEACLYTGYSRGHLYRLTSGREIPHFKRDRKLYFRKADLDEWLTETRVPTRAETAAEADALIRRRRAERGRAVGKLTLH